MSEKNKNVFEKMTEALNTAIEELQTTNDYLFGIGAELSDMNSVIGDLRDKVAKLLDKLDKQDSTAKPVAPATPKFAFKK